MVCKWREKSTEYLNAPRKVHPGNNKTPCLYLPGDNLLIFLFSFIILNSVRDCYGQLTPERSSASSRLC